MYNEILSPIIEKQKYLDANERSVYQLLELFDETTKDKRKSHIYTAKSHVTMFPKKFVPLYSHFTFEQDCFKKEFVLSNQKSRQNAKNDIQEIFLN